MDSYVLPGAAWTREEDGVFENLLLEFPEGCLYRWEYVASRLGSKTVDQVVKHYQDLVADVEAIDSGLVPLPTYVDDHFIDDATEFHQAEEQPQAVEAGGPPLTKKRKRPESKWTKDEHLLFLEGLKKMGKGDWRGIHREYVKTRSPAQVASHAQKYFLRKQDNGTNTRKRHSIHDIDLPDDDTPVDESLRIPQLQQFEDFVHVDSQMQQQVESMEYVVDDHRQQLQQSQPNEFAVEHKDQQTAQEQFQLEEEKDYIAVDDDSLLFSFPEQIFQDSEQAQQEELAYSNLFPDYLQDYSTWLDRKDD